MSRARRRPCPKPSSRHCSALAATSCGTSATGEPSRLARSPVSARSPMPLRLGEPVIQSEIDELSHAHQMFVGSARHATVDTGTAHYPDLLQRVAETNVGAGQRHYRRAVHKSRDALLSAARTEAAAGAVLAAAPR